MLIFGFIGFFNIQIACSAHDSKRHTMLPQYMLLSTYPRISNIGRPTSKRRAATLAPLIQFSESFHTNEDLIVAKLPSLQSCNF